MFDPEQQATLLEQYYAALTKDANATPPAGLDPGEALIASRLHREVRGQKPSAAFRQQLRQQLEAEAALARPSASPRRATQSASVAAQSAPGFAPPRISSLFGRLATAVLIVALLLGSLAVVSNLIKQPQPNLAISTTPYITPTPTAQPTPCNGPLGTWHAAAPLPNAAIGGAAASDGTYVYMAGGTFTLAGLNESDQLLRYNPATSTWITLTHAPAPFAAATAVYSPINKKLYVFGGAHGQTAATSTPFSDTRIYDPATNTWSKGAPMPDTRLLMAAGYWNGKIYIVDGLATLASPSVAAQTWEYDPSASTWVTRTAMPARGSGFSYGVINGHLYVTDGFDPTTGGFTTATYDYDIAADRWTTRANLPIAINYAGSAVVGNHLYVFGGIFGVAEQTHSYVYDPASDRWSSGPDMAQARMLPGGASVGNTIFAIGGSALGSLLPSVEAAAVSCSTAPPTLPAAHTPTAAPTPLSRLFLLTPARRARKEE